MIAMRVLAAMVLPPTNDIANFEVRKRIAIALSQITKNAVFVQVTIKQKVFC
jgi:hypothetical protein